MKGFLRKWHVYRSAITGRFVSAAYALRHPTTTIKHTLKKWVRK